MTIAVAGVFRDLPYMGVIRVVADASKLGFQNGHPDWANLGQGQPEVDSLPGAPERILNVEMTTADCAYGPVGGIDELREAIAAHYNRLYRKGKKSQYTKRNVAVGAGGRLILSRLLASVGSVRFGHIGPDYTAYEDLLDYHRYRLTPVAINVSHRHAYQLSPDELEFEVAKSRLDALLLSNPCNPTGALVGEEDLAGYLDLARRKNVWLLLDEFYSQFIYDEEGGPAERPVSAAEYVKDVESDPVVIIDGLTKGFRYPGWRVGWIVGPTEVVENVARAASAIDGGAPVILQRLATRALRPAVADSEGMAVRAAFSKKRLLMLEAPKKMGLQVPYPSLGTFYLWASLEHLQRPLNDAQAFYENGLKHRVMTVPGRHFDVNPGAVRESWIGSSWMRFSFGPPEQNMCAGLDRLAHMIT
ncbi:MAG: pyridoxal phosphate-dependent aminotransferase, partial [Proteobacteria bacterium]|nr:pyridoxal phosphate-dependent aminotransferase [Pseudomonadota bacterium]